MDQLNKTEDLVRIEGLTKIFGRHHRKAAELFKAGKTREEVYKATQCSVGVHDINFTIRRGELFVVMGLSGSGKSTLIRTINRLIEPTEGQILIDGEPADPQKHNLSFVFQEPSAFPWLTVEQNIRFGLETKKVEEKVIKQRTDEILEILEECAKAGHPDMVFKFTSTSKISFPGSGVAAIATSDANMADIRKYMVVQTIGHDKLNQLRHVRFFRDRYGVEAQMRRHADILRPKFEMVEQTLEDELGGLEIGTWTKPLGGYFISFDALEGCAKAIVAKAKEAGVVMTGAGATFPYGKDPKDSNIRIAPSYPTVEELAVAAKLFALCVKLVSVEKILESK